MPIAAALAFALVGQVDQTNKSINEVLEADGRFTVLQKLVKATGLNQSFSGTGQKSYTLFAPTDAAFKKLPPEALKGLIGNDRLSWPLMCGHVLNGKYSLLSFINGISAPGQPLQHDLSSEFETYIRVVSTTKGGVVANGAKIVDQIMTSNGAILVLDKVMPTFIEPPRREGLSRSLPQVLFKWGLAGYRNPPTK